MKDWMSGIAVAGGIVGIVVVIGLSTTVLVGGTTPAEQPKLAVTAADIATQAAAAAEAAAQAAEAAPPLPPPEPTNPPEPQWRFVRSNRYVDYYLLQQSGPAVEGRKFEEGVMCRNIFEAAEENMWALRNLVITSTHSEMTGFMGMIGNQAVEVTVVKDMDRNAPSYLMIGGLGVIGSCEWPLG